MRTALILAAFTCSAPAAAADHALGVELGSLANRDAAYALFSETQDLSSRGVRVGVAVHERVAIVAGWHHAESGATLHQGEEQLGSTAFFADELTLGAKADVALGQFLSPYALAAGLLLRGAAKFDDDPTDPASVGQISEAALAPGVLGAVGVELHLLPETWSAPVGFGVHAEVGYAYVGALDLADLGDMQPGGVLARAGVSLLF